MPPPPPTRPGEDLHDLLAGFSRAAFAQLDLAVALEPVVRAAAAAFGAGRAAIWLYERRSRELRLAAVHPPSPAMPRGARADQASSAARGLRLERTELLAEGAARTLAAPLRGARRALGTVVMDGGTIDAAGKHERALVDAFARQLAAAIENVYLLDEVLRQRRLLEDTFNSLTDLVVVIDDALRVLQTNNAFAVRAGGAAAALIDRPLADLVGPAMTAWVLSPDSMRDARGAAGIPQPRRIDDERLRGTFAVTVTPLITHGGRSARRVIVARDITEQARLEAEQTALRERLAQTEKLASLGQFVAGIAHEMNNPLQSVLGHLELVMRTSKPARPLRRELRRIYNEGERAAKMVQDLLVFTGSRRMAKRAVQLDTIVTRALASRRLARERAHIRVSRTRGRALPAVFGDPLLLYQAVLNVLINAEHAVRDQAARARRIEVRSSGAPGGRVALTIQDAGRGIPPDVLPQIFDPFFTTRDVGDGAGLGLTITYGIIQEHGGAIRASNARDGGAVFTIELPAAD